MARLIFSLSLVISLCINCPIVIAADGADAFSAITNDIPIQADPVMRKFLQGIAAKLKKDWDPKLESKSPSVLATFLVEPKRTWRVYPPLIVDEAQAHEIELVERELKGTDPPCKEPFKVLFVFDSWPANHSTAGKSKQISSSGKPGVTAQEDIDFGPYMARLQRKVKSNWILNKEPQTKTKAQVVFTIKKDGSIKDVHLTTKSNFTEYDKSALNAVNNSAPFLSLPEGSPDDVDIQYTFEHQQRPKLKNNRPKRFTIHLSQPDVVVTESADIEKWGHFKTF